MSGAEAFTVIGLISSIITIIETTKELYDAYSDAKGLHETFRSVATNIPLVLDTLRDCKRIQQRADDRFHASSNAAERSDLDASAKAVKPMLVACADDAKEIGKVFRAVIPDKRSTRLDRYRKAAKAVRPDTRRRVEESMKDLREKLQLLHTNHYLKNADRQLGNLDAALQHLSIASPTPISTIPFPRDLDFVVRPEFEQMYRSLTSSTRRVALVGLGGVGKSQLAIECCYRMQEQTPKGIWLLWVHVSNVSRFEESLRKLATDVKIPGRESLDSDILQLVHDWLRDSRNGEWVIVLDSADDAGFLFEPPDDTRPGSAAQRRRIDCIPTSACGSMIVTTRYKAIANKVSDDRDIVNVDPMDPKTALTLLNTRIGASKDPEQAVELVTALEYMPLAISQAAAYIKRRAPRCSIGQYLAMFKKSGKSQTSLLNSNSEELRRDPEAHNSIISTWQISFEHIRQLRPSSADLLSLMSFYDNQDIPESLLRANPASTATINSSVAQDENSDDAQQGFGAIGNTAAVIDDSLISSDDDFDKDILLLRDYLPISVVADRSTFEMHRLVQLAIRKWLEAQGHDVNLRWAEQSVLNLYSIFPSGTYETWAACQLLYPHVILSLDLKLVMHHTKCCWATLSYRAALFSFQRGLSYAAAELLMVRSRDIRLAELGQDHELTLSSERYLAEIFERQDKLDEANMMLRSTLERAERVLGVEHRVFYDTMCTLANSMNRQGQYQAAEDMYRRVLSDDEDKLGKEHPETLVTAVNLAGTLSRQGKFDEAEEIFCRVIGNQEKSLDGQHFHTNHNLQRLADMLVDQGRYEEAEKTYRLVLTGWEETLGGDNVHTSVALSKLAPVLVKSGQNRRRFANVLSGLERYEEAEETYSQVMGIQETVLGREHPETLSSAVGLARVLKRQGQYEEAEDLLHRVLEGDEKVHGKEHFNTLVTVWQLAKVAVKRRKPDAALPLYERASAGLIQAIGPTHPDSVDCQSELEALRMKIQQQEAASGVEQDRSDVAMQGEHLPVIAETGDIS